MKLRLITLLGVLPLLPLALPAQKADPAPPPSKQASRAQAVETAQPATTAAAESADTRQLYDAAKQLFDQYAPDEIKDEYEFPSHEQWEQFAQRLQQALQGGSMAELAAFEPEVRKAIAAFRMIPDYEDYADWLTERLDLIETARIAVEEPSTVKPSSPTPGPKSNVVVVPVPEPHPSPETKITPQPEPKPEVKVAARLPYYDVWLKRLRSRPAPSRADELVPLLKVIFAAEGLPRELAWLSEVESSMNPGARSPAGARGLFQLMPETAKAMGLSLFPFDERTHPGKNAKAAARLLRKLHDRFDSWPLALAAYNAGEGKVAAALKKSQRTDFAQIADNLPVETRMYVPKFFATASVREKRDVTDLPPPGEPKLTEQETTRRRTAPVPVIAAE